MSGLSDVKRDARPATQRNGRGGSREAIVDAAERLFLEHGFGAVSMDELAEAAGVARRTLYNQYVSKEEIFREMLLRVSEQLEGALPPGIETRGDVDVVLRLIARSILDLHKRPGYLGFIRMVVADSRQFPWIAESFDAVMEPMIERFGRYLDLLTKAGVLDCKKSMLAAHQFAGMINQFFLWPWMLGRDRAIAPDAEVIEQTVRMFLQYYRVPQRQRAGTPRKKGRS